jgi:hypothetical protein
MADPPSKEVQQFLGSISRLSQHLAADSMGITLTEDVLNKLCAYYSSAPAARAGRPVIQDLLGQHPYLHRTESRVAEWGFEVVISCDRCGKQETRRVASCAVDVLTAVMLGKHEACKPESPTRFRFCVNP